MFYINTETMVHWQKWKVSKKLDRSFRVSISIFRVSDFFMVPKTPIDPLPWFSEFYLLLHLLEQGRCRRSVLFSTFRLLAFFIILHLRIRISGGFLYVLSLPTTFHFTNATFIEIFTITVTILFQIRVFVFFGGLIYPRLFVSWGSSFIQMVQIIPLAHEFSYPEACLL